MGFCSKHQNALRNKHLGTSLHSIAYTNGAPPHVCEVSGQKDRQWSIIHVERKAQLSEARLVTLCQRNVRSLEGHVLQCFEQWKQFVLGGCPHHLWHALLAVSREDGCQLLEMFHFRIADRLYVYPPFGRCALPHVLRGL